MGRLSVKDFSKWLKQQVGMPYLWGGNGESLFDLIRQLAARKEQSDSHTKTMLSFIEDNFTKDIRFFDCSGLAIDYLLRNKGLAYDTTAAGLYRLCDPINDSQVVEGDWCFLKDSDGDIYHIGYVVDNDMVVHAFNQEKGVIMEKRTAKKWIYARPEFAFNFSGLQLSLYDTLKVGATVTIAEDIKGYNDEYSALKGGKESIIYPKGTYYVYKKSMGSVNISKRKGVPGAWVVL